MILALDPSTTCIGWAVMPLDAATVTEYGAYGPKGDDLDHKLIDAHRWLRWMFDQYKEFAPHTTPGEAITVYAFEMPIVYRNPATTIKLAQLVGVLRVAAFDDVERTIEINPGGRLAALGLPVNLKRAVAKEKVLDTVNMMFSLELKRKDDDIADAIAIGVAASGKLRMEAWE